MRAGNAMTTSVLSAALFALMCYALPDVNGTQVMKGPSPDSLPPPSPDSDDEEAARLREEQATTLIMGDVTPEWDKIDLDEADAVAESSSVRPALNVL